MVCRFSYLVVWWCMGDRISQKTDHCKQPTTPSQANTHRSCASRAAAAHQHAVPPTQPLPCLGSAPSFPLNAEDLGASAAAGPTHWTPRPSRTRPRAPWPSPPPPPRALAIGFLPRPPGIGSLRAPVRAKDSERAPKGAGSSADPPGSTSETSEMRQASSAAAVPLPVPVCPFHPGSLPLATGRWDPVAKLAPCSSDGHRPCSVRSACSW